MARLFPINVPLTIVWHFNKPDNTDFDITGYEPRLYYRSGNRETEVAGTVITKSGNTLSFTFPTTWPRFEGEYHLKLQLFQNNALWETFNYRQAWAFVRTAIPGSQEATQQNAGQTVHLFTCAEYYLFQPIIPTVDSDGYWVVNGTRVTDGSGNPVPSSHTVTYDAETNQIIIDQGRVDKNGNSIAQTITALDDALDNQQELYEADEGTQSGSVSGDGSRWGSYKAAEAARNAARTTAEGTKNGSTAGDGSMWGEYKAAEAARNTARAASEGTKNGSTAGDGSMWGEFKANENGRNDASEAQEGTKAGSTASDGTRWGEYKNAEQERNAARAAAEGTAARSIAGDGSMWGTFKSNEQDRDTALANAEGSSESSTAGDGSRWGSYKAAEDARDADAEAAEGTVSSNAGDGTRWGAYKTAEAARNTARATAEGSSSSTAGDGSRWGAYKTAEVARGTAYETAEGSTSSAAGSNSRWGKYKTAEAARDTASSNAEGSSSSTAGDGTRWGAYKTAEAARGTAYGNAEGTSSSEAGDGTRWGAYKTAEAAREADYESHISGITDLEEEVSQLGQKVDGGSIDMQWESGVIDGSGNIAQTQFSPYTSRMLTSTEANKIGITYNSNLWRVNLAYFNGSVFDSRETFLSSPISISTTKNVRITIETSSISYGPYSLEQVLAGFTFTGLETIGLEDRVEALEEAITPLADVPTRVSALENAELNGAEFIKTHTDGDYRGTILELYVVAPISAGQVIGVKQYGSNFYLRPVVSPMVSANSWQSVTDNTSWKNKEIIELKCTTADAVLGVAVGDTVGYIIFKDIASFRSKTDSSFGQEVYPEMSGGLVNNTIIAAYLNGVADGKIKTPMIADGAVTAQKLGDDVSIESALEKGVDITLPDEIVAVEGETLQIFYRSIICAFNPYIFNIRAVCDWGKAYPRYYTFTPTAANVGSTKSLTVSVMTNNLTVLVTKTVTIRVVANPSSPVTEKKVLCVGASATSGGQWVYELRRLLTASDGDGTPYNPTGLGLSNITFVGRKTGTAKNVPLEATGGWRVQDYAGAGMLAYRFQVSGINQLHIGDTYSVGGYVFSLAEINVTDGSGNIRCVVDVVGSSVPASGTLTKVSGDGDATISFSSSASESYNPFRNESTSELDFESYANNYCNGGIDIMVWHCGVNDIFPGTNQSITAAVNAFKDILDAYHAQFPNGKVIISSVPLGSPIGGFGANYGASANGNYFTFAKQAQKYAAALQGLCGLSAYSSFCSYSPVMEEFDSENAYPVAQKPVNNRVATDEGLGTNALHPTEHASYMVSDAVFRTISDLI